MLEMVPFTAFRVTWTIRLRAGTRSRDSSARLVAPASEELTHFLVAYLREVVVPLTHGLEALRNARAHHLVHYLAHRVAALIRCHRHRGDESRRPERTERRSRYSDPDAIMVHV